MQWISADPGPFSVALTISRKIEPANTHPIILSFVASHTHETAEQVSYTANSLGAVWFKVDTRKFELKKILSDITQALNNGSNVIGIDFSQENFENLNTLPISKFARSLVETIQPAAVFASGGETAAAVLRGLEARAFTIDFEILPLAVSGRLVGGPFEGLLFATKGGLIGSADAIATCFKHLMQLSAYRKAIHTNRKATTL